MRCKACRQWIDPYLDGVLPDKEREAVEAHVGGCADCASEVERSRALLGLMAEGRADDWVDADNAWSLFRARAAREDPPRRPRRRFLDVLMPAAVTCAVAAVAVTVAVLSGNPGIPERAEAPPVAEATGDVEAPPRELIEVLVDLELYEHLDFFEEVDLLVQADLDRDLTLLEELLAEVEG